MGPAFYQEWIDEAKPDLVMLLASGGITGILEAFEDWLFSTGRAMRDYSYLEKKELLPHERRRDVPCGEETP